MGGDRCKYVGDYGVIASYKVNFLLEYIKWLLFLLAQKNKCCLIKYFLQKKNGKDYKR